MTYTTKSGDTWDGIAFDLYGNEQQAQTLIRANTAYINMIIVPGGIVLEVPEAQILPELDKMPPWRRGQ